MPEITPFKGLCFNSNSLGSLDSVITPPYDVITPEQRADLAQRSSHSMVHLILPEERDGLDRYEVAAQNMAAWRAEGALKQDEEESFYILDQTFEYGGVKMSRRAFFATARIPENGDPAILGHEQTFARTVEDRLSLTKSTRANLGPVFVLYADPDGAITKFLSQIDGRAPDLTANTLDGVTQKLWRVSPDPAVLDFFRNKRLYIADGHHRYGTACAYRDLMREQEGVEAGSSRRSEFVLLGFVSLSDPGLAIYPTHRLLATPQGFELEAFLRDAGKWFNVERIEGDAVAALDSAEGCALVFAMHGAGAYLLRLKNIDRAEFLGADRGPEWRDLDVAVLHRGLVQNVMGLPADTVFGYERDAATALERVEQGEYDMGFLLKATRADQIQACAEAAQPMPHKSTYFFPKLPSGAVIHSLE